MAKDAYGETVRSIYDSFNRGDLDAILAILAPGFELFDLGISRNYHGPAGFRQWLEPWDQGAPDGKAYLHTLIAEGDTVATEHTHRGTHTGPFATPMGVIPASGRRVEVKFAEFFKLKDGKIVSWVVYWDMINFLRQLGAEVSLAK